jgi:hypothetical protein
MRRRAWAISGIAVILVAAGTVTAVLVTGSSQDNGPDYKALPTCGTLAAALPGPPTLAATNDAPSQPPEHGLDPAFMDLQCATDDVSTAVAVDVYQAGSLDLATAVQYTDKAVHDGKSRAKTEFARRSVGLDKLNSKVRYSSHATGESTCTVYTLKRNAVVMLAIPVTGSGAASPDQFKAACKQIAKSQMSKLVAAALVG